MIHCCPQKHQDSIPHSLFLKLPLQMKTLFCFFLSTPSQPEHFSSLQQCFKCVSLLRLSDLQCNPRHVYTEVIPTEFNGSYSHVWAYTGLQPVFLFCFSLVVSLPHSSDPRPNMQWPMEPKSYNFKSIKIKSSKLLTTIKKVKEKVPCSHSVSFNVFVCVLMKQEV